MEYFMEFKIGIANAWIGSLISLITNIATFSNKDLAKRMGDMSWYRPREKKAAVGSFIFSYGMMILTIWIPFKIGTPWFYAGLFIFITGFVCNLVATHNYATTPKNEAIRKGMYRISRNPLYLFFTIMFLGLVIASLSLPLLIFLVLACIFTHIIILGEERYCLETYPESFKEYMQKVPRYILFF